MLAASQVGHVLANELVYPEAQLRWRELLSSGHSYFAYWPLVSGVAGGVLLVGVVVSAVDCLGRRSPRAFPAWAFALLPLVGFAVQEFTERWLAGSNFPWWIVLQPTFRIGLLLQLPFAVIAFLLARLLLRATERVVRALRGTAGISRPARGVPSWFVRSICPLRPAVLADGHAGRGPPADWPRPATSLSAR